MNTIYLAGPISNCNDKQRTKWREAVRTELKKREYECIDPASFDDWLPLREMIEIERADLVIANLWRESIGTVVGIMQARSKGKPVILIDPNYLESPILEHIVGRECIVHSIDAALKLLPQVTEQLNKEIKVRKGSDEVETFKWSKLHASLSGVCAKAQIEDALLPDLVANAVHAKVRKVERNGEVRTEQIKQLVFETLSEIVKDNLYYEDHLKRCAEKLRNAWERHELEKKDQRYALEQIDEKDKHLRESNEALENLRAENNRLQSELKSLSHALRKQERSKEPDNSSPPAQSAEELRKSYANYFPRLVFAEQALKWLLSSDRSDRYALETKFRLMNQGQTEGKHQVRETQPLLWQHDAGDKLKIYFRQDGDQITVVRLGTKGSQDSDYAKLKR